MFWSTINHKFWNLHQWVGEGIVWVGIRVGEGEAFTSWSSFEGVRQVSIFFMHLQSRQLLFTSSPRTHRLSPPWSNPVRCTPILCINATSLGVCPKHWKVTNHWFKYTRVFKGQSKEWWGKREERSLKWFTTPLGEGFWHLGHYAPDKDLASNKRHWNVRGAD